MKVYHDGLVWIVKGTCRSINNGQPEYIIASNDKIKVALASRCHIIEGGTHEPPNPPSP